MKNLCLIPCLTMVLCSNVFANHDYSLEAEPDTVMSSSAFDLDSLLATGSAAFDYLDPETYLAEGEELDQEALMALNTLNFMVDVIYPAVYGRAIVKNPDFFRNFVEKKSILSFDKKPWDMTERFRNDILSQVDKETGLRGNQRVSLILESVKSDRYAVTREATVSLENAEGKKSVSLNYEAKRIEGGTTSNKIGIVAEQSVDQTKVKAGVTVTTNHGGDYRINSKNITAKNTEKVIKAMGSHVKMEENPSMVRAQRVALKNLSREELERVLDQMVKYKIKANAIKVGEVKGFSAMKGAGSVLAIVLTVDLVNDIFFEE